MTSKASAMAKVIAAGMFESAPTEILVLRAEGLPSEREMPALKNMPREPLETLYGSPVLCLGYSVDKFDSGPRVSVSGGRVVALETTVIGTNRVEYPGGVQTTCVNTGGSSGGAIIGWNHERQVQLVGILSSKRNVQGAEANGNSRPGFSRMVALNAPLDFDHKTGKAITIRSKIAELIANGSCD